MCWGGGIMVPSLNEFPSSSFSFHCYQFSVIQFNRLQSCFIDLLHIGRTDKHKWLQLRHFKTHVYVRPLSACCHVRFTWGKSYSGTDKFWNTSHISYILCTVHFVLSRTQTNKYTILLVSISYIFNPYIFFGKYITIFRGYACSCLIYTPQICETYVGVGNVYLSVILCTGWFDLDFTYIFCLCV